MGSLQGKVIIVTGASTGMGRAIAVGAAAEGATLGLVARNKEKLEEAALQARTKGAEVLPLDAFPVGTAFIGTEETAELVKQSGVDAVIIGNAA